MNGSMAGSRAWAGAPGSGRPKAIDPKAPARPEPNNSWRPQSTRPQALDPQAEAAHRAPRCPGQLQPQCRSAAAHPGQPPRLRPWAPERSSACRSACPSARQPDGQPSLQPAQTGPTCLAACRQGPLEASWDDRAADPWPRSGIGQGHRMCMTIAVRCAEPHGPMRQTGGPRATGLPPGCPAATASQGGRESAAAGFSTLWRRVLK